MDVSILVGEVIGTAMLVLLGNGVVANHLLKESKGHDTGWLLITTGWGLAVAMAAYSVGRISGAHLNPAVTLGFLAIGQLEGSVVSYLLGQMVGAMIGAVLVWLSYLPHWGRTENADHKLGCFCTGPAIRNPIANFICEFVGTAVLLFGILAIAANAGEISDGGINLSKVYSVGINPLLVGFLVWSIGISLGGPTGYAINPARDLGPRIIHAILPIPNKRDSDWSYAWIPIAGPIAGGIAGAILYQAMNAVAGSA